MTGFTLETDLHHGSIEARTLPFTGRAAPHDIVPSRSQPSQTPTQHCILAIIRQIHYPGEFINSPIAPIAVSISPQVYRPGEIVHTLTINCNHRQFP